MGSVAVRLRPGRPGDAEAITRLLAPHVATGAVLARSPAEIREQIGSFVVAVGPGGTVGAVALRDFGRGLQEIRSLVVTPKHTGRGVGSRLIRAAVRLAGKRGAIRVFTLTMRPRMFVRLGFLPVDRSLFPLKVWSDCSVCPKWDRCDETALLLDLSAPALRLRS